MYFAVIADLIRSREIKDRAEAQKQIAAALDRVNQRYKAELASKFTLTLGDEFQGLLNSGAKLCRIIDELDALTRPYRCRFGIGLGSMATEINPEASIGADGEAYWRAREAINYIHANDDYEMTRTYLLGPENLELDLVNNVFALTDAAKADWTELQWETFAKALEIGIYSDSFEQKLLAEALDISEQALYRRLKLSGMKVYLRSRGEIEAYLQRSKTL